MFPFTELVRMTLSKVTVNSLLSSVELPVMMCMIRLLTLLPPVKVTYDTSGTVKSVVSRERTHSCKLLVKQQT